MATGKFCDLLDFIDWSSVECLNQKPDKELANAIKQVLLNSGHNLIELTDSPNLPTKPWAPEFRHVFFAGQGYREDDGLYLESDTDEQLLIYVPFNQSIKLGEIIIKATDKACAPKRMKIFANRHSMGFDQASEEPATQEFELNEAQLDGEPLQLKFVKFQNVNAVTIFIEDNQEDEETTKVMKLQLMGLSGEKMDVKDIKKVEEQ